MADVIFSGTDGRKPLSMAEVSLNIGDVDAEHLTAAGVELAYNEVTITRRVDSFDGAAGSATNPNLRIAANATTSIHTRWCSVAATAHTAQSTFSGTDANGNSWTVTGPLVRLSAK